MDGHKSMTNLEVAAWCVQWAQIAAASSRRVTTQLASGRETKRVLVGALLPADVFRRPLLAVACYKTSSACATLWTDG